MIGRYVLLVLALLPCAVLAQDGKKPPHVIRATGEATVSVKPDRAQISIGVVTQAQTAQAASSQNAAQTRRVLDSVKQTLGSSGEVKTTGYSIGPDYEYSRTGGSPKITGYHADNTVLVTVDDLPLVGKIVDAANSAGANKINGISFTLKDDEAVRAQALAKAATNARTSAEAIAKALNVRVLGVLRAESTESSPIRPLPQPRFMAATQKAEATPIESGNLDVHASVMVTLEVQ